MKKKIIMRVDCGSLKWKGEAISENEAIVKALSKQLPTHPGVLLRIHNGFIWKYVEFWSAMKIAGYSKVDFERP